MIVPMKKLRLLCLASDTDTTLSALRELGAVHLDPMQAPTSAPLDAARQRLDAARQALSILDDEIKTHGAASHDAAAQAKDADDVVERVHTLARLRKEFEERIAALLEERATILPYGDFDAHQIESLAQHGVIVKLYRSAGKTPPEPPEGVWVFPVSRDLTGAYFATVALADFSCEACEFVPHHRPLSRVDEDIEQARADMAHRQAELHRLTAARGNVAAEVAGLEDQIGFLQARAGMGAEGPVAYLGGYCPEDAVAAIRRAAEQQGWGLVLDDPAPDDPVPTLVRYPAWARLVKPVFSFLGIVPGYREVDISSAFFIFLSIFFAMIVGDAGYGLLFLILLPYFRKKKCADADPAPFRLLYIFSACTVAWGILTGNYFGLDYELLPGVLQALRIDWLLDQNHSMTLSLALGGVHLTVAHGWNVLRYGRHPRALVQLGWIGVVWGIFAVARLLLVKAPFPPWLAPISIGGGVAILAGLVIQRQWMDLGLLALDLVSCFGDLMSYLRLFALGIASVKVADAFNGMAGDLGAMLVGAASGPGAIPAVLLAAVGMGVVLAVGHGLNIILCAMSVLVHGVRLNALEFSLHIGQEWSGHSFRPFARPAGDAAAATT